MDLLHYFEVVSSERIVANRTLAEKHAPTTVSQFMGNYTQIKETDTWFETTHGKSFLLVVGPTGCGKTTLINLMCEKHNKTIYLQNSLNKRTKTELNKYYESVKGFVTHGIFVFDELECMINKSEIVSLNDVSKWVVNNTKPSIRIVLICNDSVMNKLSVIIPLSHVIRMEYPIPNTLFRKCMDIAEYESIYLSEKDILTLKTMIANMKEPRMIINSLNLVGIADSHKDNTLDMYSIYRLMLMPNEPLDKKLRYFTCESGTIPIIIQENYIDTDLDLNSICKIADSMSVGDVYHKAIFVNNDPVQMHIYACLSSVFHYLFDSHSLKEKTFYDSPRFGSLWTRMSAMYQKKKYWARFDEHCHDPYINTYSDLVHMNDIYKHIFLHDKPKFLQFLNYYRLDNVETAFDLYNAYNVSTKIATKKSFVTAVNKLRKDHSSSD